MHSGYLKGDGVSLSEPNAPEVVSGGRGFSSPSGKDRVRLGQADDHACDALAVSKQYHDLAHSMAANHPDLDGLELTLLCRADATLIKTWGGATIASPPDMREKRAGNDSGRNSISLHAGRP